MSMTAVDAFLVQAPNLIVFFAPTNLIVFLCREHFIGT